MTAAVRRTSSTVLSSSVRASTGVDLSSFAQYRSAPPSKFPKALTTEGPAFTLSRCFLAQYPELMMIDVKGKSWECPSGRLSFIQRTNNSTTFGYDRVCNVAISRAPEQCKRPTVSLCTHVAPSGMTFLRSKFFLMAQSLRTRSTSSSTILRFSSKILVASTLARDRLAAMLGVSAQLTRVAMSSTLTPYLAESRAFRHACAASRFRFSKSSPSPAAASCVSAGCSFLLML
mmetsp:Transcript_5099/g.15065  ORF Transcript_5099/g.15065 Transcript_5099/m.15065 type:complete len:231 (+) Transcript_5099:537-1229(+)